LTTTRAHTQKYDFDDETKKKKKKKKKKTKKKKTLIETRT